MRAKQTITKQSPKPSNFPRQDLSPGYAMVPNDMDKGNAKELIQKKYKFGVYGGGTMTS